MSGRNPFPPALNLKPEDLQKMLACKSHIGTKNLDPNMEQYVWKRNSDGFYIINLGKTWEKLQLAARAIATIENPSDVCVISARPYGQRAALKFANNTGAQAVTGRFTPGTFTNQIQKKFLEPRLLILTDPRTDHQPVRESSYVNIPTIAFTHTDSPLKHIDIAIPCNNKARHSIGLMYWLLCREVLYLRNTLRRNQPWNVMVDLFFYRDPDEADKEMQEQEQGFRAVTYEGEGGNEWGNDDNWTGTSEWGSSGAQPEANNNNAAPQQNSFGWDNSVQTSAGWDQDQN